MSNNGVWHTSQGYIEITPQIFNEIKSQVITTWMEIAQKPESADYLKEKLRKVGSLSSEHESVLIMIRMFDRRNQRILSDFVQTGCGEMAKFYFNETLKQHWNEEDLAMYQNYYENPMIKEKINDFDEAMKKQVITGWQGFQFPDYSGDTNYTTADMTLRSTTTGTDAATTTVDGKNNVVDMQDYSGKKNPSS